MTAYGPIPRRYKLSLSTFAGIVPMASHYYCRVRWHLDGKPSHEYEEDDAEHGRGENRTGRFDSEVAARSAGLRLIGRLAKRDGVAFYTVTEGAHTTIDPQRCLKAPGNLKARLNKLWRRFEKFDGWNAPRSEWPKVQALCDSWSSLIGEAR